MDTEISVLKREVYFLRAEIVELKEQLAALRSRVADLAENEDFAVVEPVRGTSEPGPSDRAASTASATVPLSWAQREEICKGIGIFLRACLSGGHRGASGRDTIPLASKYWIAVRSFDGTVFSPVRVFSNFTIASKLVKKGASLGKSVFIGVPSQREIQWVVDSGDFSWVGDIQN